MAGKLLDSLYVSGAGVAAASGTVSLYQPGTLVPVTAWSDDALTQPVTQPVALDALGKTVLPLYVSVPVRAIVKSQAGATLYDITRIDGQRAEIVSLVNSSFPGSSTVDAALTALGTSLGGTNGQYLAPGSGAVARNLQTVIADIYFDVKNYGAVGNGIADDTTACQAAIAAATSAGGGVVYFPPGNYLISSALSVTSASVDIIGAGNATTITQSNVTANGVAFGSSTAGNLISSLSITHSSSSSGAAIQTGSNVSLFVYRVNTPSSTAYLSGLAGTGSGTCYVTNSRLFGSNSSSSGVGFSGAYLVSYASTFTAYTGAVVSAGIAPENSTFIGNTGNGLTLSGGASHSLGAGNFYSGVAHGVSIASGVTGLVNGTGNSIIPDIVDNRTGAPVNYTFAADGNFTPLPLQTDSIRVVATAAATVTINAIAATGFGRRWSLICARTTASAVTWTFNAQYVLSAAVAPANGNRVNLLLEYSPLDNKVYEIGRAATSN